MDILDSIIEKLKRHMLDSMGFSEDGDKISKTLSVDDYCLSDRVIKSIMNGEAYRGMNPYETIKSILVDNYIGEHVMDKAIWELPLTDEEKAFFDGDEDDEDDDDFTYNGYSEIESWVSDQNITVDSNELKDFIAAATRS